MSNKTKDWARLPDLFWGLHKVSPNKIGLQPARRYLLLVFASWDGGDVLSTGYTISSDVLLDDIQLLQVATVVAIALGDCQNR